MRRTGSILFLLAATFISGCQSYVEKPLSPVDELLRVEHSRRLLEQRWLRLSEEQFSELPNPDLSFLQMADWLGSQGPALLEARAEFETFWAVAKIKTPMPNPEITVGPQIGSKLEESAGKKVQPFINFGFSIPLGGRLKAMDDVNHAMASGAFVQLAVTHRLEYLRLRRLYAEYALMSDRVAVQKEILRSAESSLSLAKDLAKAGTLNAIDLGLMELELARHQNAMFDLDSAKAELTAELSALIGVSPEKFGALPQQALPSLEDTAPSLLDLKMTLVANHGKLALLRAEYESAEKNLKLEIVKQFPDFKFGSSFEGDPGDRKKVWGLSFGFEIPVFDQNQQEIARADKQREAVRIRYQAELSRVLALLEGAKVKNDIALKRKAILLDKVLPLARKNLEDAEALLKAGNLDALKYLEVERGLREILLDALNAELEIRRARASLEEACGSPLFFFPGENSKTCPFLPEKLEDPYANDANKNESKEKSS